MAKKMKKSHEDETIAAGAGKTATKKDPKPKPSSSKPPEPPKAPPKAGEAKPDDFRAHVTVDHTVMGDMKHGGNIVHEHTGKVHHNHKVELPSKAWWIPVLAICAMILIGFIAWLLSSSSSSATEKSKENNEVASPAGDLAPHWQQVYEYLEEIEGMEYLGRSLSPQKEGKDLNWVCPARFLRGDDLLIFAEKELRKRGAIKARIVSILFVIKDNVIKEIGVNYKDNDGMGSSDYRIFEIKGRYASPEGSMQWATTYGSTLRQEISREREEHGSPYSGLPSTDFIPRTRGT